MKVFQRWKQTALHNQVLVLTGVLVAVGTLVYTGAAISQYYLMKQTAKEQYHLMKQTAKESGDQVDKIITEAKNIAFAAKSNVEQSKRALDATIEMSRKDQRAWVGMMEVLPEWNDTANKPLFIKEGAHYRVGVTIVNSGKTPALKVRARIRVLNFLANKFVPDYGNSKAQSVGVLQPQGKYIVTTPTSYREISASDMVSLKNGTVILFLFGEIDYADIFGIPHRTTFCSKLAPTLDQFYVHSKYNSAN